MITTTIQPTQPTREATAERRELPLGWRAATLMRSRWVREERAEPKVTATSPTQPAAPPRPARATR